MATAGELRSGKGHRDENFPVASWLIDARHRAIILAFYEFVRVADDIADHACGVRSSMSTILSGEATCLPGSSTAHDAMVRQSALGAHRRSLAMRAFAGSPLRRRPNSSSLQPSSFIPARTIRSASSSSVWLRSRAR